MVRKISILGATGSVGRSTVDLALSQPERFDVQAVTCNSNTALLAEQAVKLRARRAVTADKSRYDDLKQRLAGTGIETAAGTDALIEAASLPADWIMAAIVGIAGLKPVMAAIDQGSCVAIANKEPLVAAGSFVRKAAALSGATLLPVDSEHNAIFQVFDKKNAAHIEKIILTASGGPFLDKDLPELENVTPAQAVRHPNWSMGAKISVDSATMMNKALEVIEAHYLFDMPGEKIDVLVHPQSVIHSLVAYTDGSVLAQMGASDMRTPIAHALAWPERMTTTGKKLDFTVPLGLDLRPVDTKRFPVISLAYECLRSGQAACVAFNAANEVAVEAFLAGRIKFLQITDLVHAIVGSTACGTLADIDAVIALDRSVRRSAKDYIDKNSQLGNAA